MQQYMGPSIGWVNGPDVNPFPIGVAGTYHIDHSSNYIPVGVAGAVTIILPSAVQPNVPAGVLPGLFMNIPVVIFDAAGFAGANPITIKPFSVSETILGLTQIQITVNYGGFTLLPVSPAATWISISP
jgi:hypothetical protein